MSPNNDTIFIIWLIRQLVRLSKRLFRRLRGRCLVCGSKKTWIPMLMPIPTVLSTPGKRVCSKLHRHHKVNYKSYRPIRRYFRILKLRWYRWAGFKLTSSERSEITYWITRNIKESTSETLRKVRGGE